MERSIPFSSLSRNRIPFDIVAQITGAIARGEIHPGDKLPPEAESAAQLGVGRNALREAIKILEACGLVVIRRGDGTYIQDNCTADVLAPLFLSLIWVKPTRKELVDCLLSLRHAQLSFGTQRATMQMRSDYLAAHRDITELVERGASSGEVSPEELNRMLHNLYDAREALFSGSILTQLHSLSSFIYSPLCGVFDEFTCNHKEWEALSEIDHLELAAAMAPTPQNILAYLDTRKAVWYRQIDQYGAFLTGPASTTAASFTTHKDAASKAILWELINDIIHGIYSPGEKIPTEVELMERFQVSRNVIREATKCMEALGIVEIRRPEGSFITEKNDSLAPFVDYGAYGRILAGQGAELYLNFKIDVRDATMFLACQNASKAEREEYHALTQAFAQTLSAPAPSPDASFEALHRANSYLTKICANPILQRVNQVVAQTAEQSRQLFLKNAIKRGYQQEVIQSYLQDADILLHHRREEIPEAMKRKVDLWAFLEIADAPHDS